MNYFNLFIFAICIEVIFTLFVATSIIKSSTDEKSFLYEPIVVFLLGSTVIYLLVPTIMMLFDWNWHQVAYSRDSYLQANLMVFGYMMAVLFIYYLMYFFSSKVIVHAKNSTIKNTPFKALTKKQNYILIFFFLIPILIDTLYLLHYILSFNISEYLKNRIQIRKGMGLIILISYMGTIVVPIFFANILTIVKNKKKITKTLYLTTFFIVIVFPFLSAYVIMGNRLTAFILLILLILIYLAVLEITISFKLFTKFLLGFIFLFMLFTFLGFLRLMGIMGESITSIDYNMILSVFVKEIEHAFVLNFGNHEHLVWLIENNARWEPLNGETFIAGLLNIVPRSLLENKLLGGGPNLKNIIHPGSYDLAKNNISSYTTGIAIETFMNFKFFGLFIIPFFHALFLLFLKKISENFKGNIVLLSIYLYLLFSVAFLILFGEFLGIYTRSVIVVLPFVLYYLFMEKQTHPNPTLE